jgi:predicted MPP superfamily phosphohydrolase
MRPRRVTRFPKAVFLALIVAFGTLASGWQQNATDKGAAAIAISMPNKSGSLKFAVLGDFGTGEAEQYELAAQMAKVYTSFKFELAILVGDNLYGSERPQDFRVKFEVPYKPLLDAGVVFRASLGNHDSREQRSYKPFNMNGELYYSFKAPAQNVRFFALESTYMEPQQLVWFEKELKSSNEDWKIAFFHHPLYSSAGRHGSDLQLRGRLEPLLVNYNVSVVFTGHDHVYERVKPQKDITYFVTGSGGQLAVGDLDRSSQITAKGFDTEQAFLIAEIIGDEMTFNAISRSGKVIDQGTITRRKK